MTEETAYGTQYAVRCARDGRVRDISTPDYDKAQKWAADRDRSCGACRPGDESHTVVIRTLSPWLTA